MTDKLVTAADLADALDDLVELLSPRRGFVGRPDTERLAIAVIAAEDLLARYDLEASARAKEQELVGSSTEEQGPYKPTTEVRLLSNQPILPAGLRGDGPCQDCGTLDNIVWFTDNALWNEVCPAEGILCVPCFVTRAGDRVQRWKLTPEAPGALEEEHTCIHSPNGRVCIPGDCKACAAEHARLVARRKGEAAQRPSGERAPEEEG